LHDWLLRNCLSFVILSAAKNLPCGNRDPSVA
jgi:hypothetical protein